ncbi:uncharacterized protein GLRG_01601 [Colletotrichum graminicola M1.001]|uniref:Uncharacterized protein n=1 Tax=Colletotrichum graminicola (strain M1.001 / M2 / FGSC 10212) TaxID=645133 RepID=E3Q6K9_COLGM|nr:uncharacterized protein GLRG_01601 [Colletotrichum graminicola M1.001]EFQ26457.1 hypothetical protein GLRG_01601 [Colletotrichum graminicola M1.001]
MVGTPSSSSRKSLNWSSGGGRQTHSWKSFREVRGGAEFDMTKCSGATRKEEALGDVGSPSTASKRMLSLLPVKVFPQTPSKASEAAFTVTA